LAFCFKPLFELTLPPHSVGVSWYYRHGRRRRRRKRRRRRWWWW
jgi:hypothetical protein